MYQKISDYYSQIFPVNPAIATFLRTSFTKGMILDVGCADAMYLKLLHDEGMQVCGLDATAEFIAVAQQKLPDVAFCVGYLQDVRTLYPKPVQGLYCIGNTLAHVSNHDDLVRSVQGFYEVLEEDGVCVIAIINYDRIYDQQLHSLPPIQKPNLTFLRHYELHESFVRFFTELIVDGHHLKEEQRLYPIRSQELLQALQACGFTQLECFGDFTMTPFDQETSMHCLIRCRKVQ